MIDGLKDWALRKGYRMMRKEKPPCPGCGEVLELPEEMPAGGMDAVFECGKCEWRGELSGASGRGSEPGVVGEKPEGSVIVSSEMGEEKTWLIPAARKGNFFWFFGGFWWALLSVFLWAVVVGEFDDEWGRLGMGLFLTPFVLAGIFVVYMALKWSFEEVIVVIDPDKVRVMRKLFGKVRVKEAKREEVIRVKMVSAHEQNDEPVYEVGFVRKDGKTISVGSQLEDEEKGWLLGEFREALGMRVVEPEAGLLSADLEGGELGDYEGKGVTIVKGEREGFRMVTRNGVAKWLMLAGAVSLMVVAVVFGSDLMGKDWGVGDGPWFVKLIGFIFDGLSAVAFLVGTAVSLGVLVCGYLEWGTERRFEFSKEKLVVSKYRKGVRVKQEFFQKSGFREVRSKQAGHVNGEPRYEVSLLGEKKVKISGFLNEEDGGQVEAWLRGWVGNSKF
ncbi:MAG: hypothetical protein ACSHYF_14700 [Verrucomicrobiaceae bacterium]